MKPARFDYVRAESLAEVHEVLAQEGADARIIAGGQTLMPMLSMRLVRPAVLVDVMRIPGLDVIEVRDGAIRVDAAARQATLGDHPGLGTAQPLLAAALPWVGHAQTRNRGTVCGSLAHADPSAELGLVLLVLGGSVELSSRRGRRTVASADFFQGVMSTARADDELIEAAHYPLRRPGEGMAFAEFGRRHGDFAIVACAAVADASGARLAVGGVADRPVLRDFGTLDGAALDDALSELADDLEARDDLHATADHRRRLVRALGRRMIEEARRCRA
jgi:2-furoyl-CoA dehydrogenase FAD binding subunit